MKPDPCPPHHAVIESEKFIGTRVDNYLHLGRIQVAVYRWWGRCKRCGKRLAGESVRSPDRE